MAVNAGNASAAIVQHVPAAAADTFQQWQRGVTAAAQDFAGYQGTNVYPPVDGAEGDWVTVIHFADDQSLQHWLGSSVRATWVSKLRAEIGDFDLKSLHGGFSPWFAKVASSGDHAPPAWKMAATVLLGLYPTVMLLTIFVGPYTSPLGLAVAMLIGNALSVAILQWIVMPPLTQVLGKWLESNSGRGKSFAAAGLTLILLVLAGLTLLFRQVTG